MPQMFLQFFLQIFALYNFFRKHLRKKRRKFSMDLICFRANIKNNSVGWSNIVTLTKRGKSNNLQMLGDTLLIWNKKIFPAKLSPMIPKWSPSELFMPISFCLYLFCTIFHYISKLPPVWLRGFFMEITPICRHQRGRVEGCWQKRHSVLQQNIQWAPENIVHSLCIWSCKFHSQTCS